MSFDTEAAKLDSVVNLIIKIDGIYFAQRQIDSGLVIDSDKLGLIRRAKISGNSVDIRKVKTSIASLTFDLLDKNGFMSTFLMTKDDNYLEKNVELLAGFNTGSFDFADYKRFTTTKLKSITKSSNAYAFRCDEITSKIKEQAYVNFSELTSGINDSQTTIDLADASSFPATGRVKINNEYMSYLSILDDTLQSVTRSDLSSTSTTHSSGTVVSIVTEIEDNPIDIMLDIMQNVLLIPTIEIDLASFISIRDTYFPTRKLRFQLTGQEDVLTFFEKEILQVTNCRITSIDGLIGLAIFDQTDFTVQPVEMDEDTIEGTPNWKIGSDKIVNEIIINWNYNEGQNTYSRVSTFKDSDSVSLFGPKKTLVYNFKGVRADLDGSQIVSNMGARLLARTKNTQADIKVNTLFDQSSLKVGDDLAVSHRFIPGQGAGLGMADQRLEIMSKAFNFDTKRVTFKLQFTSFSNLRIGLIAPSPLIVSVTDQKTFEVPIGTQYKAGYFLRVWDIIANDYYPDAPIEILSVTGNIITMANNFTTTLTTSTRVKFPTYSQSSDLQSSKYAYTAPNTHIFPDGKKAFEILFS